eukprot:314917_1
MNQISFNSSSRNIKMLPHARNNDDDVKTLTDNSKQSHDNSSVIKCGYLEKESLHLKIFRKRWIVLTRNKKLNCYKTESCDELTEIIDLNICKDAKETTTWAQFELIQVIDDNKKERKRIFIAPSFADMSEWVSGIQNTMNASESIFINGEKKDNQDVQYSFGERFNYWDKHSKG